MAEITSILHLTDLHLGKQLSFPHERLIDALCKDLDERRKEGTKFDFCVFSGDIANTGEEDHFTLALDQLLRIAEAAGLDDKRLLICPGNHDADRRIVGENLQRIREFRKQAQKREGANLLLSNPEFIKHTTTTFRCFNDLADEFCRDAILYRDAFCTVYFLRSASVVVMNTALLTATGLTPDLDDRGALAFPEASIVHALKQCPEAVPKIVVGHHPIEFFNDVHASMLSRIFADECVAYLCGHLHEPSPKAVKLPNGELFISQGGALYESSEYWNGYAVVSADLENGHFKEVFRRWWEPRREFSVAEDLANKGVFFSCAAAEKHWANLPHQIDKPMLETWRTNVLLPSILKEYNEGLTDHSLEEVFVAPEFEKEIVYRTETEDRIGSQIENVSFDKLLAEDINVVISAQKETGKTAILRQMALSLARRAIAEGQPTIPVLVNFNSFRHHKSSIEGLVRQRLPQLPLGENASSLLEQGAITLLIDDVDFRSIERRDGMLTFFAAYPRCRYILASSTTFVESAAFQPEISPDVPFVKVRTKKMRPGQLLSLIEKHGTRDPLKADQLLERVTRNASSLNVPLTAVTSTFLIQIFSEEKEDMPVNQAALVERYIDMLLQKYAPRELIPATFNFRNKVDLLSVIAERMARAKSYEINKNEFLGWIIEYLKDYGLKYAADDIVKYLLESRIIECDGEVIRFRLKIFFEFFLATRMREDQEFKEFVFSEGNYLGYPNEISFYAAITMRDRAGIDEIYKRFMAISARIPQDTATGGKLVRVLEEFEVPDAKTSEEELFELQQQIISSEQAEEDRKALLEGEGTELIDSASQAIVRPTYENDEERWLGQLVLLSGMLKHMELIPDKDKRKILASVLDGWLRFAANSLGIVGTLAKKRRVVFNGVTYRSLLSDDLAIGDVARRLAMMMPIATAKLASLFLATEKLQLQLEEGLGSKDEPVGRQFLRFAILSDLMVDDLAGKAVAVEECIRGHNYLTHVFARKLYEIVVRYRLPDGQLRRIKSLVGDLFTNLSGVVGQKELNKKKVRVLKGLERQRLIATIRDKDEK